MNNDNSYYPSIIDLMKEIGVDLGGLTPKKFY